LPIETPQEEFIQNLKDEKLDVEAKKELIENKKNKITKIKS
jgi:hypothetical protein